MPLNQTQSDNHNPPVRESVYRVEPNRLVYGFYDDISVVGLVGIAVESKNLDVNEDGNPEDPIISVEIFDFSIYQYEDANRNVKFVKKIGQIFIPFNYIKDYIDIKGHTLGNQKFWLIASPYKINQKELYKYVGLGLTAMKIPIEFYAAAAAKFKKQTNIGYNLADMEIEIQKQKQKLKNTEKLNQEENLASREQQEQENLGNPFSK